MARGLGVLVLRGERLVVLLGRGGGVLVVLGLLGLLLGVLLGLGADLGVLGLVDGTLERAEPGVGGLGLRLELTLELGPRVTRVGGVGRNAPDRASSRLRMRSWYGAKISSDRAFRCVAVNPTLPGTGVCSLISGIALGQDGSRLQSITRRE